MKTLPANNRLSTLSSHFYREFNRAKMQRALTLRKDVMHYKKLQNSRHFELGLLEDFK